MTSSFHPIAIALVVAALIGPACVLMVDVGTDRDGSGLSEGSDEGQADGAVEGNTEGHPEGAIDGTPDGNEDGNEDGQPDGSIDGEDLVPEGWLCFTEYYGAQDGCDCGCGIVDVDCADSTINSCDHWPRGKADALPHDDNTDLAARDSVVGVPDAWNCAVELYNEGSGSADASLCDCGCGVVDADCPSTALSDCRNVEDMGGASTCSGGAAGWSVSAADTTQCTVHPRRRLCTQDQRELCADLPAINVATAPATTSLLAAVQAERTLVYDVALETCDAMLEGAQGLPVGFALSPIAGTTTEFAVRWEGPWVQQAALGDPGVCAGMSVAAVSDCVERRIEVFDVRADEVEHDVERNLYRNVSVHAFYAAVPIAVSMLDATPGCATANALVSASMSRRSVDVSAVPGTVQWRSHDALVHADARLP